MRYGEVVLLLELITFLLLDRSTKSLRDAEEALEIVDIKTIGVQVSKSGGICEPGSASECQEGLSDCVRGRKRDRSLTVTDETVDDMEDEFCRYISMLSIGF